VLVSLGVAAVVVAGSAGGAVAWVAVATPSDPYVGYCYPNLDLDRGGHWTGTTVTSVTSRAGERSPVELLATCQIAWRMGTVFPPGTTPAGDDNPVPELHGCVTKHDEAAVFPGDAGVCERLGLPALANG
jgi:hypothetical protein